ncbi:MAG TPA: LUD domain-containing protein, partial [Candidatus Deferrimicrobium sp.]|nr:LUD domain-containing protein [Candidatus Deferrimicrobium sp.]
MDDFHRKLKDRIDSAVTQDIIIKSRKTALNSIRQKHIALELQMPLEDYKKKFRSIKNHAIANLSHLVDLATIRLRENGCNVYHANKVQDVLKILDNIIDDSLVVKCKTNMAKEIRLKEYLESRKIEIVETDLGDRIVQLSQSHASHPLIPSLHIPKAQAAKLFHITKDPQQLTIKEIVNVARAGLRDIVLKAKISISGANAITAEEGLICLEENEGNQRLITSLARKHIVLAGIDKVVPTAEDAVRIMKDAAYYG